MIGLVPREQRNIMENGEWGMENGGLREQNHIILLTFIVELGGTRIKGGGKTR